ncbi:MAG TPA: GSCFA domain-containing protein [Bacteroidales bacterium]|nr:GSCFA domain-containing protein [Bacteroidales bacterium]
MDIFRTVTALSPNPDKLTYNTPSLFMGSCFTENLGSKLTELKFPLLVNPFGTTYNPASSGKNIFRLISGKPYEERELEYINERWFSFDHHSRFSAPTSEMCLQQINSSFLAASEQLKQARFLFLTFGTAWVYIKKSTNEIVNNCHKIPAAEFNRELLTVKQITDEYEALYHMLKAVNPEIILVFTISPVRHLKDGAHGNQISKSTLLLATEYLINQLKDTIYFPAYEILLDELRDYRFYDEDMVHPNSTAVKYITSQFFEVFLDQQTRELTGEVQKIITATHHRPFNKEAVSYKKFAKTHLGKIRKLESRFPEIQLQKEKDFFSEILQ